jgi:NAD(P)H-flavin reductase
LKLRPKLNLQIVYVLERPPEGWTGERGFVTGAMLERLLPRDRLDRQYLMCGPPPMMAAVHQALVRQGIPLANIQMERFNLA